MQDVAIDANQEFDPFLIGGCGLILGVAVVGVVVGVVVIAKAAS